MKKVIHHIRKQPEHIKRHILYIMIIIFAVILFIFWIYSLGTTLTNTNTRENLSQDLKPFSLIKDNLIQEIQ